MNFIPKDLQQPWSIIRPILSIHSEEEYDLAVDRLEALLREVGDDEGHPLYELVDTLGTVIHAYEEIHHRLPESSSAEVLGFLLQEHRLTESDLTELGSGVEIAEILNGTRELAVSQIRLLANRFQVSPAVFV